jgi:hypothetical protein
MKDKDEKVIIPIMHTDLKSYDQFSFDPPDILYHYTDLNGASGIIISKSLRLTKLSYLNDTSELKLGISIFRDFAQKKAAEISNSEKKEFLYSAAHQLDSFEETNICVSSFCENGDLLSQWRAYGRANTAIAVGFSSRQLKRYTNNGLINLWKCVYDPKIQTQIMLDLIENLLKSYDIIESVNGNKTSLWQKSKKDLIGYFNTTFLRIAPVLKNNHFCEEKEWRLITVPMKVNDDNYNALITNDRVSQYYSLDFTIFPEEGINLINTISIGPSKEQKLVADALWVFINKNGFKLQSIYTSQIPYRSQW